MPATAALFCQQDLKNNWWKVQQTVNIGQVQSLFRSVDFIGVSAYAGLPRYPNLGDLETSLRKVDQELQLFGMDLRGLGKEIIYSEYGECAHSSASRATPLLVLSAARSPAQVRACT